MQRAVERTSQLGRHERLGEALDLAREAHERDRDGGDGHERSLRAMPTRPARERDALRGARLEQQHVGRDELVLGQDLVPEARHESLEQLTRLGDRFGDAHARHDTRMCQPSLPVAGGWYEWRMKDSRILVVDDEADVRGLLRELLERAGASVREARDGREALRLLYDVRPELVVLDVSMPDLDGWGTLERIRDMTGVPVLMLTAHDGELEKVRGLKGGADDYVTKPFGRQELLARCDALLRRHAHAAAAGSGAAPSELYEDATISVDVANASVTVLGSAVSLTPLEFRLLLAFVRNPAQVLARDQILELVWGDVAAVAPDQVKLYVGYLRRKLEGAGATPIETVRGFGYRYVPAS